MANYHPIIRGRCADPNYSKNPGHEQVPPTLLIPSGPWDEHPPPPTDTTYTAPSGNIATYTLPAAIVGEKYYQYTGAITQYGIFVYNSAISKPEWLEITQVEGMLEIKGIPPQTGNFTIILEVTLPNTDNSEWDGSYKVQITYELLVVKELKVEYPKTDINVVIGESFNLIPKISSPGNYDCGFDGEVPDNLVIDSSTGKISGKFTKSGTYKVSVIFGDAYQTKTISLTFNVSEKLSITYPDITAIVGEPLFIQPTIEGGEPGPKEFKVAPSKDHRHYDHKEVDSRYDHHFDDPLPSFLNSIPGLPGLVLNYSNGTIAGIPLKPENTSLKIECIDKTQMASTSVRIYILGKLKMRGHLHEQEVGRHFAFTPHTTGGIPADYHFSYTCEKELPKGLSFDTKDGRISGVCETPVHDFRITIICTDANQVASLDVVLNVIHHENVHHGHRHHHDERRRTREEKTEKRK
ncbi:MAG: putative Ig domain-containing protein [Acetobacter sp.]|nr:putative Ig domain-containing protein [Acetobacter sp.]